MENIDYSEKYSIPSDYPGEDKPWEKNHNYFTKCKISLLSLIKILNHAKNGKNNEVMGSLYGIRDQDSIIIFDVM